MLASRITAAALSLSAVIAWTPAAHAADPAGANPSAPAPELPAMADAPVEDPVVSAERARIVGKGRGLVTAGSIFSGLAVVGLATTSVFSVRGNTRGALASAGVSVLLATTGLALVVPGRKRIRNPERYMKSPRVAFAPVLTREVQGAAVTLRF